MINYTNGNWTVSDNHTDTVTAAKTISIPDLSYDADFEKIKDSDGEVILANTTSTDLNIYETVRFAKSKVSNVYQGFDNIGNLNTSAKKSGVQAMVELKTVQTAINSVTGVEEHEPLMGRVVIRASSNSRLTAASIKEVMLRTFAACFATGSANEARMVDLLRGIVDPQD